MKRRALILLSGLYLMLIISIGSGCALNEVESAIPSHKHRKIWIDDVYYEQVYFFQGGERVIVSQQKLPHKDNK